MLPSEKLSYQKHNILIQDYDQNLKKSKQPKFFAENKRFIYKFDSFVNENSNPENPDLGAKMVQELKFNPNQEKDKSSIGSTQVENPLGRRDDLIRMIDEPYIPHSGKSFRFFQLVLLVSSLLSLGLLAYLSTTVSNNVQSALSEYSFIEKFKTQLLDSLMLTQEAIVFGSSKDRDKVIIQGKILEENIYEALNRISNGDSVYTNFYFTPVKEIKVSLISSLYYLTDRLLMVNKNSEVNQAIIVNAMRIFRTIEEMSNMDNITTDIIQDLKNKLFILVFLSISINLLLTILQIFNFVSIFGYINSVLKFFLSISIMNYRSLLEKIIKYREFKRSKEAEVQNEIKTFYRFQTNLEKKPETKNKNDGNITKNKRQIRLLAVPLKIPILKILFLGVLYIIVFSSFMIAILSKSQVLDDSLSSSLEKLSLIMKTKSYNYQLFIRITDKVFFQNSFGYSEQENQQLLMKLQYFLQYSLDQNSNLGSYDNILQKNLCELMKNNTKYQDSTEDVQECNQIGDGVLAKGFYLF